MILVIGGAFQGKREYARQLSGLGKEAFERLMADGNAQARSKTPEDLSGESFVSRLLDGKRFLVNCQGLVRQALERGEDVGETIRQVLEARLELITLDEVGCGIVPLERSERVYREAVGTAGQILADSAREVYRMTAGIAMRIR